MILRVQLLRDKFCVIQGVRMKEYKGISNPKQRRRAQNLSAKTKAKGREGITTTSLP